jgi:hypothetical protein
MTRFTELRRLEAALASRDLAEIEWALEFAKIRLRSMTLKEGVDEWRKRRKQAESRLAEVR